MQQSITISPEFFRKARNDYSDQEWAVAREFMQNSIDARSQNIRITIVHTEDGARVTVRNDGKAMSHEILTGKLLSLGASGKDFDNTVGGFGKAKEILYFTHASYQIRSGSYLVNGSGGTYDIQETVEFFPGTESTIHTDMSAERLINAFRKFFFYGQWTGTVTINDRVYTPRMKKGSRRKDYSWGVVYTNKSAEGKLVVRINGMPMFISDTSYSKGAVVVELNGNSGEILTANRDGLQWYSRRELDRFVEDLAVDRRSALKREAPTLQWWDGEQISSEGRVEYTHEVSSFIADAVTAVLPKKEVEERLFKLEDTVQVAAYQPTAQEEAVTTTHEISAVPDIFEGLRDVPGMENAIAFTESVMAKKAEEEPSVEDLVELSPIGTRFCIKKNLPGMKIPKAYLPGSFSPYAEKLIRRWVAVLTALSEIFPMPEKFSVGFIFDEDGCDARYEVDDELGPMFLINPVRLEEREDCNGHTRRTLIKKWKTHDKGRFISVATHEMIHYEGLSRHDEDYANLYTERMGEVLNNIKSFNGCFRAKSK